MPDIYIGLGTNIGRREENLLKAIEKLGSIDEIEITGRSSVMETEPVDYLDQPSFLNQVVRISTTLEPGRLLDLLKGIEADMGRESSIPKGPRVIDLDILLYEERVIKTETLTIPHPEIINRSFVLKHLLELDPDLVDPATAIKYREAVEK
jgi:2-amino-4-hydroxy-6-hydroxymethyldihydropteridine diphosphokinase